MRWSMAEEASAHAAAVARSGAAFAGEAAVPGTLRRGLRLARHRGLPGPQHTHPRPLAQGRRRLVRDAASGAPGVARVARQLRDWTATRPTAGLLTLQQMRGEKQVAWHRIRPQAVTGGCGLPHPAERPSHSPTQPGMKKGTEAADIRRPYRSAGRPCIRTKGRFFSTVRTRYLGSRTAAGRAAARENPCPSCCTGLMRHSPVPLRQCGTGEGVRRRVRG
jgi:hypothetical protein